MKIEVLFPEFCNLFGDAYNMVYLEKTLPEAEFIRTKFSDDVRFTEEKMNLVYMGPMTERMQEQVIRKLMPLKEKIQKPLTTARCSFSRAMRSKSSAITLKTRTAAA